MSDPESDNMRIGREIYQELDESGDLAGHYGEDIWIDTRSRLHAIGVDLIGAQELKSKVAAHKKIEKSEVDGSQFYFRRIGKLTRHPIKFVSEQNDTPQ